MSNSITRRDVLKTLSAGVVAGSVLKVIPAQAAEYAHRMVLQEKKSSGAYQPKFFTAHQYATLRSLCQTIIPPDEHSGGAIEAGAPEFIDLLTSENTEYQLTLGGGLMWLDSTCSDRYRKVYLDCAPAQQKEILDLIAYSENGVKDPRLSQGTSFFAWLRKMTCDGFFTSEIGIKDLQYIGNTFRLDFPGCPPPPES
ncbi:MAG TPA: gluconate 2-dehydrogenase subunit 3 family protein [Terriglobales bacterium]|nr:gluconate 2-dehydrogenase subunit 3 family protein [Terriglobales bacterium]